MASDASREEVKKLCRERSELIDRHEMQISDRRASYEVVRYLEREILANARALTKAAPGYSAERLCAGPLVAK